MSDSSSIPFRIVPTIDELKQLREKFYNIKDLSIFKKDKGYAKRENLINTKIIIDKNTENVNLHNNQTMVKTLQKLLKLGDENNNKLFNEIKNSSIPEKEIEIQNQRFYEVQAFIEANKQKINQVEKYDELVKENQELREENERLKNTQQYLKDNKNIKELIQESLVIKNSNISLQKEIDDERKMRMNLEKQINILKQIEGNKISSSNQNLKILIFSLLNKDELINQQNAKILDEIFNKDEVNWSRFLGARVDALEFQNYKLVSKHEKYSNLINNYIDELIEFIEVISDIKNVVNQVYESQALTKEFLIIRDTLNTRDEFLEKQKKFFLAEKENIQKELIKDLKFEVLLTHDKITENYIKLLERERQEGVNELIEEKIEELQNIKNNLASYEDYLQFKEEYGNFENEEVVPNRFYPMKIRETLSVENVALKTKFTKLKSLLFQLIKDKNIDFDEIRYKQLNAIMNTNYDVIYNEEIFSFLKAQAFLMEYK